MANLIEALANNDNWTATPLFVHAHPDDETLQTGALLAWCASRHVVADVVTCTRGERGEMVPGSVPEAITEQDLVKIRERELLNACQVLRVGQHFWLGRPPARAIGATPRVYRDSGMRWISPGLAGPAEGDDPGSFTAAELAEATADLVELIEKTTPTVLISYDEQGSYGHPDHIRTHQITAAAAGQTGLPFVEVASAPDQPGFSYFELPETTEQLVAALNCYRTQLSVIDGEIVHVGGQHQELPIRFGLRYRPQ